MKNNARMLTDISLSPHTTLPTPNNVLHSIGMLALSPGLKRIFGYLEGLLSFIRVWGSKNDRFQQLQQLQQQQQQTRQVRMLQSENFLEQIKSHPSDTFFYFLNHETLTSIKSVKNSFSVKSGGLKNYKLLIRKPLLTCQFSQETCLIVFYYQKEKLLICMVVRKLCLMYMLVRKLLLLTTSKGEASSLS